MLNSIFSGAEFKGDVASRGWYTRFMSRHPELPRRLPSLIDPGGYCTSRSSMMDSWVSKAETFLNDHGLFNEMTCIYNIDESWFCPKVEQKQKIVVTNNTNMPYKLFDGAQRHTNLTLCIAADGSWLPPMLTFKAVITLHHVFTARRVFFYISFVGL